MADAYQTRFWRTLIQLASGVYDITEWTSRSYPVYTAQIERLRLGGRRFPFKDIVGEDSSFVLSGLIYGDEDQAHILRRAMLDSDSAMPLCMQLQSKHWWLATYKMPDMPSDDDRAFFSYSMNMQSEGEDWRHGTLLDTVTSEQPATDVAAGAQAMIALTDAGSLTALKLRYRSSNTDYEFALPTVDAGIYAGTLRTAASQAQVPASRARGSFYLMPTPANASFEARIGYGELI